MDWQFFTRFILNDWYWSTCFCLAMLYTLRIVAGITAIQSLFSPLAAVIFDCFYFKFSLCEALYRIKHVAKKTRACGKRPWLCGE